MKILISGGNGFLGGVLREHLKRTCSVKTIGASEANDFVVDLSKNEFLLNEPFDCVIHTAAIVHNEGHAQGYNNQKILDDFAITRNLIRSLKNIKVHRFIYISSVAVYNLKTGENIDVNSRCDGTSGYGLSKRVNELYLIDNSHHIENLSIIRLPLIIGENVKGNLEKLKNHLHSKFPLMLFFKNGEKSVVEVEKFASEILHEFQVPGIYNHVHFNLTTMDILKKIESLENAKFFILNKWISTWLLKVITLFPSKVRQLVLKLDSKLTFEKGFRDF